MLIMVSGILLLNGGEHIVQSMLKIVHNLFMIYIVCLYFQINIRDFTIKGVVLVLDNLNKKLNFILKISGFVIKLAYKNIRKSEKFGVEKLSF